MLCWYLLQFVFEYINLLGVTNRVRFKLAVLMYRCLHGTAPSYLMDSCTPTADVTGRQHLRSATQRKLIVPRYRLNGFGRRSAFCCCGPVDLEFAAWQPSWPRAESQHFQAWTGNIHFYEILTTKRTKRIRDFLSMRYINLHFAYLLTHTSERTTKSTFAKVMAVCDKNSSGSHVTCCSGWHSKRSPCIPDGGAHTSSTSGQGLVPAYRTYTRHRKSHVRLGRTTGTACAL